jgi:hypothetical protein
MDRIHSSRPSARTARNADPSTRTSETAQVNIPSKPVFKQDSPQDTTPAPNTAQPLTSYQTSPSDLHDTSPPPAPGSTIPPQANPPQSANSPIATLKAQMAALQDQLEHIEQAKLGKETNTTHKATYM